MKRILYIGTNDIYGGVGHIMFQICSHLPSEEYCFDFMYYEEPSEEALSLMRSFGSNFFLIPRYTRHPFKFIREIKEFYKNNEYDIVHIHASTSSLIMYAFPVWHDKRTKIVYQSHVEALEGFSSRIKHLLLKKRVTKYSDLLLAVSQAAALFMYGKNKKNDAIVLKNGIVPKDFEFNPEQRANARKELLLDENAFLLGHVGRFCSVKNQTFIVDVFEELQKKCNNSKLIFVGNGEDMDKIVSLVNQKGLSEKVIFYGTTDKVSMLLSAMDCFIFPSLWEGLGIVAIESQMNGLPVVASDKVPSEANVSDIFYSLSLENNSLTEWADKILSMRDYSKNRHSHYEDILANGYDITAVTRYLSERYAVLTDENRHIDFSQSM